MNILLYLHMFPPHHNAGSEWMMLELSKFLISKGHRVRCVLRKGAIKQDYHYQGVDVFSHPDYPNHHFIWANVVFTHLDQHLNAIFWCRHFSKPLVHFIHNSFPYPALKDRPEVNLVYNGHAIIEHCDYHPAANYTVLNPPVNYRDFEQVTGGEYITLININKLKGGEILRGIAEAMPDKKFLGVIGGYDDQITDQPSNVTIHPHTDDIKSVYAQTRVLIMPSSYESWGRTATEAMASGIPVIHSDTFGLRDNCGEAGIMVKNRDSVDEWVKAIKSLDKPKKYAEQVEKGSQRAKELDPVPQMEDFERWLIEVVRK